MERYFQPEIECASREQIKAWQDERLVKQVRHVWDNVPAYRKKMEEKGVTPEDIRSSADLHKLPFTSKADLRDNYPDGLVAVPRSKCVRVHATSGTTGKRVMAFYTQHDINLWTDCCARAITAVGGSEEDVCQIAYGYGMFTGGIGLDQGSRRAASPCPSPRATPTVRSSSSVTWGPPSCAAPPPTPPIWARVCTRWA